MKRPPPYFPQSQLSPPDENRYRKVKLFVGLGAAAALLVLVGLIVGLYYLVSAFLR